MDPAAALAQLLDAIQSQDREATYEALENLQDWFSKGGFFPKVEYQEGTERTYFIPQR